jgi:hypothetical protein
MQSFLDTHKSFHPLRLLRSSSLSLSLSFSLSLSLALALSLSQAAEEQECVESVATALKRTCIEVCCGGGREGGVTLWGGVGGTGVSVP